MRWDALQQDVIEEPHDSRLLVSAGPGTGKTAIACARVSHLIDKQDLSPDRIWMISFTRTAMREIRNRIADHVEDPADAYSVKLATLDSHAWAIQSGFSKEDRTLGSYNENIQKMREIVRNDEAVTAVTPQGILAPHPARQFHCQVRPQAPAVRHRSQAR